MDSTPVSLLEQLRSRDRNPQAWRRLVRLYTPLLTGWARSHGLHGQDADDLVQDVFVILLQKLPDFKYDYNGSFRAWLKTVTTNRFKELIRRRKPVALEDSAADALAAAENDPFWEADFARHVMHRALQLMKDEFAETTWRACWEHVVSGKSAAEVGAKLGISEGAVNIAKYRVLRFLRREHDGMLD